MKRSERIKQLAETLLAYGTASALMTIATACLGYAHHAGFYPLAILFAIMSVRYICDGMNKLRLARVERRYEISREIRHNIQAL